MRRSLVLNIIFAYLDYIFAVFVIDVQLAVFFCLAAYFVAAVAEGHVLAESTGAYPYALFLWRDFDWAVGFVSDKSWHGVFRY